jgi:membrane protease YdiL (CAAX protease family)
VQLRTNRWALFLLQQAGTFSVGLLYLGTVRLLTGKTLHGGEDPLGWLEFTTYVGLVAGLVWGTSRLHQWVHGPNAPDLGLAPSRSRFIELLIGLAAGALANGWMWMLSLATGTAQIADVITNHHAAPAVVGLITLGVAVALLNGLLEETSSRAFPARLFGDYPLWFRVALLAAFFALQHLVDEPFEVGRFLYLVGFGAILTLAYIWRGNIWLPLGLHSGYLLASIAPGGRWHLGSIYDLTGTYAVPLWLYDLGMLVLALVLTIWMQFSLRKSELYSPRSF